MTNKKRFLILSLLAALAAGSARRAQADDFGYWMFYTLRYFPASKLELTFFPEMIFDKEGTSQSYLLLNSGIRYGVCRYMDVGFQYAYVRARTTGDVYVTQHWESPDITFKAPIFGVPVVWRNRMEFRQEGGATNRYRGRILVTSPKGFTPLQLVPYGSHEIFYDFSRAAQNQTRTTVGVTVPVDKRVEINVFYLRQGLLSATDWRHINYIGSDLRITVGPSR